MKVLLIAILDHKRSPIRDLLQDLSKKGYNGSVIPTSGIHQILPNIEEQGGSISLSSMVDDLPSGNITLLVTIDEEKLPALKEEIVKATDNFHKIKGGLMVVPVLDYQGVF